MSAGHGWEDDALCREVDPEVMFPDKNSGSAAEARAVCKRCTVPVECLADAMAEERGLSRTLRHGFRGGLSPNQRAALERSTAA